MPFNTFNEKVLAALDAPEVQQRMQQLIRTTVLEIQHKNMAEEETQDLLCESDMETKNQTSVELEWKEKILEQSKRIHELENMLQQAEKANLALKADMQHQQAKVDAFQEEKNQFKQTIQHLQEVLSNEQQNSADLAAQMNCAVQRKEEMKQKYEQTTIQLENQEKILKKLKPTLCAMNELNRVYQEYRTLPQERRKALGKILKDEDMISFLVHGSQFENIRALWEHVKSEERYIPDEQRVVLVKTIEYFIHQINLLYDPPLYRLVADPVGTDFSPERHVKAEGCSPYQSHIQEVLLPGIWNERKQQFVCKCLVRY